MLNQYLNAPKYWAHKAWANSVDPDLGAVWSGSALFATLPKYFDLVSEGKSTLFKI